VFNASNSPGVRKTATFAISARILKDVIERVLWRILHYIYSKTSLKRNAIVPVFFSRFHGFPFYKGLCFNKTKYKKYDRLGLQ